MNPSPDVETSRDVPAIPGPVLLDRLVGWATVILTVVIIPMGLVLAPKSAGGFFERYGLLAFTFIGAFALTRSSRAGFYLAVLAFSIRGIFDTLLLGQHPGDRFISSSWFFDIVMIGYAIFRIRALALK